MVLSVTLHSGPFWSSPMLSATQHFPLALAASGCRVMLNNGDIAMTRPAHEVAADVAAEMAAEMAHDLAVLDQLSAMAAAPTNFDRYWAASASAFRAHAVRRGAVVEVRRR